MLNTILSCKPGLLVSLLALHPQNANVCCAFLCRDTQAGDERLDGILELPEWVLHLSALQATLH